MEYREHEGVEYIKFDGLPYLMRTYVQSKENYSQDKMIALEQPCKCGMTYYYPKDEFYKLLEDYNE